MLAYNAYNVPICFEASLFWIDLITYRFEIWYEGTHFSNQFIAQVFKYVKFEEAIYAW